MYCRGVSRRATSETVSECVRAADYGLHKSRGGGEAWTVDIAVGVQEEKAKAALVHSGQAKD